MSQTNLYFLCVVTVPHETSMLNLINRSSTVSEILGIKDHSG